MEETSSARLLRSRDRILGGVCGGLAKWLGWDVTIVRLAYILISIMSAAFPGTIVYIILWIIMPEE
jgi:phage shock protein PspC (stress-responsive transcriptional regulator)